MELFFEIETEETSELSERNKLFINIVRQAMEDYWRLAHPLMRKKKYLDESFSSAVDMFFDDTFRFQHIQNDYGEDMSIEELLFEVTGREGLLEMIQKRVIEDSRKYWEERPLKTLEIPNNLVIDGHVYSVIQHDSDPYIDFDGMTIYMDKAPTSTNQETLVRLTMGIAAEHADINVKLSELNKLSSTWFRIMRLNNCFTGAERLYTGPKPFQKGKQVVQSTDPTVNRIDTPYGVVTVLLSETDRKSDDPDRDSEK